MAGSSVYRLPAFAVLAAFVIAVCAYVAGGMRSDSAYRAQLAQFAKTQTNLSVGVPRSLDGAHPERLDPSRGPGRSA